MRDGNSQNTVRGESEREPSYRAEGLFWGGSDEAPAPLTPLMEEGTTWFQNGSALSTLEGWAGEGAALALPSCLNGSPEGESSSVF